MILCSQNSVSRPIFCRATIFFRPRNDGSNISMKAPTSVLIKPDGRTLHAFGYDAEETYIKLIDDSIHDDYYFFHHFKMSLYGEKTIPKEMMLQDEHGKSLPASTVFSLAIHYLKDDLLAEANSRISNTLRVEEIQWVLTVPAIWSDSAKQFMRICAVEAGIQSENLLIALEPEAASLVCKHLTLQKKLDEDSGEIRLKTFTPGSRYLVLDAGGGTIDIVVHEVLPDNRVKELYTASGGCWGGNTVNKAFIALIAKLVGEDTFEQFKKEHTEDYLDLQRAFEVKKRTIKPDQTDSLKIKIPVALLDLYSKKTRPSNAPEFSGKVELKRDKGVFDLELIKSLFTQSTENIIKHIETVLAKKETEGTSTILMVGGYSESPMLYEAVKGRFLPKLNVITQHDAGLAVLKGAVIFGHDRNVIKTRVSRFTYGLNWFENWNSLDKLRSHKRHEPFDKVIEVGEEVTIDKKSISYDYTGCSSVLLKLVASVNKDPVYVDDEGCFLVGNYYVRCCGDVTVCLEFGDTEIRVIVEHEDGSSNTAAFEFPG